MPAARLFLRFFLRTCRRLPPFRGASEEDSPATDRFLNGFAVTSGEKVVGRVGLEPTTTGLKGRCSNQLS
jgi:hypothetical protein